MIAIKHEVKQRSVVRRQVLAVNRQDFFTRGVPIAIPIGNLVPNALQLTISDKLRGNLLAQWRIVGFTKCGGYRFCR